ncbi:DUF5808 domain-containing protein [Clostridium saccharoperbutylacetonicum]
MNKENNSKHWKLGIFYYNPDDPSEVIEKNNGNGSTINFASKGGRRTFALMMIPAYIAIILVIAIYLFYV